MKSIITSLKKRFDLFILDPQLSQIEFVRKKVAFNWNIGSVFSIIILTILAYFLGANIIGHFGVVLLIFYTIEIPLFRKHNYDFYQAIFLALFILTAFVFILIFGGYSNSAGLVFVGLTCVISSILMKSVKVAFMLFFLYIGTILGLAIFDPFLKDHPDITPKINFIFFIINTIWMSGAMMFFIITYLTERNKYQLSETKRLQDLDAAKSQLFTNITHEFRTPITLIEGIADQILDQDGGIPNKVGQIKKQSRKLLNLVNQILDLAKIDSNTLGTIYVQANIIDFLRYLFESFHSAADSKGIRFQTIIHEDKVVMDFDQEKLETIIVNLITNAIKFTQEGGVITIETKRSIDGSLLITVMDTGIGIDRQDCVLIFNRFYQVKTDKYQEGNGIGLTIVKEFVQLMNGQIMVESELGNGSTFKIRLPIKNNAPQQDLDFKQKSEFHLNIENSVQVENRAVELPLLLIIDDHKDIVDYVKKVLKNQYRFIEAMNGREGYEKALEFVPDIIISDVMMPEMDGFEFLQKVKSEFRTSHIPVMMLTAKTDRVSKLEGLELGAEAYLVKPFDKQELYIRLRKMLDLRKTLHSKYQKVNLEISNQQKSENIEDQFMNKVRHVIDNHLDDESFNIKTLCRELGMSHTQLYRKFSVLTDITVNKYIRQYRLHKAMNLLKSSELNISQVALEVGLPNLAYFSRVFTEEFKINPSKVKQSEESVEKNTE